MDQPTCSNKNKDKKESSTSTLYIGIKRESRGAFSNKDNR